MLRLVVGVVLALSAPVLARPHARETAARAAAALRGLRSPELRPQLRAEGGRRQVYVVVDRLTPACRTALEQAGLTIELPAPGAPGIPWTGGEVVQGQADDAALATIPTVACVRRIERPGSRIPNVGAYTTAGDAILRSDQARLALGTDGSGVTVGVISDGVDHMARSVASGDLPPDVTVPPIPGVGPGSGDEGTALLEIVHDVAPGARLFFSGPATSAEMVAAIDGLAAAGANVVVDDFVFTDEPKFEDGPIAEAARRFVAGGGVYVTAAGNFARSHYFATYHPTGSGSLAGARYASLHDFRGGDVGDSLSIPAGAQLLAILQWNDPFGAAADDFDLVLVRPGAGGDTVLAASTDVQDGTGNPIEAIDWVNQSAGTVGAYLAVAEYHRVTPAGRLRLNILLLSRAAVGQQYVVSRESVFGHAAVSEVLSVAAVDANRPAKVEPFSSRGPASIFFPTHQVREAPRIAGVDDVTTAVGRFGFFEDPFRGTSAAAPHVAGCAAVLLAAGATADRTAAAMVGTAVDIGRGGTDPVTGAGLLDCASAGRVATGTARPPELDPGAAGFDETAALVVSVPGQDPDADARSASVTVRDSGGRVLVERGFALASTPEDFVVTLAVRGPRFARARSVNVMVKDGTGLTATRDLPIACGGDAGSLGEALCSVGDLLDRAAALPGGEGRRLVRLGRAAAAALSRAGRARAAGRSTRPAVRAAIQRLARMATIGDRVAADAGIGGLATAVGQGLRPLAM